MKGREYSSEKYKKSENTVDTKEATIERRDSPGWFILVLYAIAGIVIGSGGFYLHTHLEDNSGGGEIPPATSGIVTENYMGIDNDPTEEGDSIATYRIEGMSCGGCLATIRQALSRVNGVDVYEVYIGRPGKAVVEYDPRRVSSQKIADAITKSGYPATLISKEEADRINGTNPAGCGSPTCGASRGGGCGCEG